MTAGTFELPGPTVTQNYEEKKKLQKKKPSWFKTTFQRILKPKKPSSIPPEEKKNLIETKKFCDVEDAVKLLQKCKYEYV